jgi:hypothetical protein
MAKVTPGPPATPGDLEHARELQELQRGELEAVRAQAEKWRTGLGGLVGLATVIAGVRGASGTAALDTTSKIVSGVLLLLAVVFAAVGSFVSMRAAYGFPGRRLAEASLDELVVRRRDRLRRACRDLRRAVLLAYLALAMLVGAVGITWFV